MAFKYVVLSCLVVMANAGLLPAEQYTYSAPLTYSSHAVQEAPITYAVPITKYAAPVSYEAPVTKVAYNAPSYEARITKVAYTAPSYEAPIAKVAYTAPTYEAPITKVAYSAPAYEGPITKVAYSAPAYEAPIAKVTYTAPSYEAPITKVAYAAPIARVAAVASADKVEAYEPKAQYSYSYDVQDGHTGDSKSQHESRDGDVVRGSYSVVDPDGTKRTVDYTADPHNGFNAVVHKEPIVVKLAPVSHEAKISAPVTYASAPAVHSAPVYQSGPVYQVAPVYQSYSSPANDHH